jgi:hypothetical protein
MSVKAMGLAWELKLTPAKKYILLAYVDHADHDGGNIYPSVGLVAWKTGYSVRQVQLTTKELVKDKLLIPDGVYKNSVKRYRFDFKQAETLKMAPYRSKDILVGDELDSPQDPQGVNVLRSRDESDSPQDPQGVNVLRSRDESDSPDPLINHQRILTVSEPSDGASAQPPAPPSEIPPSGEKRPAGKKTRSKDESLRIQACPSGELLWAELDYSAQAEGRRPPEYYESAQQRDGFLAIFAALGDELPSLVKKALKQGIKSRARLLSWLEGCAAKRKAQLAPAPSPDDFMARLAADQATARERVRLAKERTAARLQKEREQHAETV